MFNKIQLINMRTLTNKHVEAYKSGIFKKLFAAIREDPELSFEIRMNNEVMVYYRKDKILSVCYNNENDFKITPLNPKYYSNSNPPSIMFDGDVKETLRHQSYLRKYFREAKRLVHAYKMGVEFDIQQNIALGNRDFNKRFLVVDMEWQFSQSKLKKEDRISRTRIDLIVIDLFPNTQNTNDIYLAELKVGTGATEGKSGIIDHVSKTKELIDNDDACTALRQDIECIIGQKYELGLIEGKKPDIKLSQKPKMMLILAYRGNDEYRDMLEHADTALYLAKELKMDEPFIIMHDTRILIK